MRLQDEVARQEAPHLRIPMHAAAADAVRRHEGAPTPDRKRGLVDLIAERESKLVGAQEKLVAHAVTELVLHLARRKVGRRVAPWTTLDRHDVETLVGELVGHDRPGPAKTDDDDVLLGKLCAPSPRLAVRRPFRPAGHADWRQRIRLVMSADPIEIIVAGAGIADHLPGGHIAVAAIDRIGKEAHLHVLDRLRRRTPCRRHHRA